MILGATASHLEILWWKEDIAWSQAEFYAIHQNNRESVEDYFFCMYAIYEKNVQQQN